MSASVDYVPCSPPTYVVRCEEHADQESRTQWGVGRMTIFQGLNARGEARRYAETHNAIQH